MLKVSLREFQNMTIGIIGGGQLGRMFIQNGLNYGLTFHVLDPDPEAPCKAIAHHFVCADRNDEEAVYAFGQQCDVVTIEIENVSIAALKRLEADGKKVFPQSHVLERIKDKGTQKEFYQEHSIPTAPFRLVNDKAEISQHLDFLPAMQKMRVGGYDGKGVYPLHSESDLANAFDAPSVLEQWVPDVTELAVLVVRNERGEIKSFPLVELVFNPVANLVDYLVSPAEVSTSIETQAREIAESLINKLDMVGLLAVEMFLSKEGVLMVNEVAPRPHNSGHHSIEACVSSQFDQHLRSILNWPLGDTTLRSPAAMINLLGEENHTGPVEYSGLAEAIGQSGVYPHFYGKALTKPYRKMGHVTVIGNTREEALEKARLAKESIKVISK